MRLSIITLFPEAFEPILNTSILKRAQQKGKVVFELINLRGFGEGRHKVVDDRPYGGGTGMILRPDILTRALKSIVDPTEFKISNLKLKIILTSASGKPYKQKDAQRLSNLDHLIIVCGHYEGVDQRFIDKFVDEEISIGDYVLTGGEIPAMVIVDSITRLIPGVLEKPEAVEDESFSILHHSSSNFQLLEHPQYTRPEEFEGEKAPEILLSGNHAEINKWRYQKSLEKTKKARPDLLK
ncbi:tRNA (guanosine(37)-N1)-methyltransferase TrmD [Candidatus Daviesbacteria bacterium RIFCSPHIGHO2_02_FULL_39_12]|uniref:tRNA (guanine-N(1)-)-methyltransferase n=2 Tax=Candidatus Daviesiibacteriota TaxID=1752718 RepID=A0A1F5JAA3_9BACT|nr:MAG: tRNA (guanosine(37)-N1)-methyltransferase TrmD [Candidatus Daviesbacteria bacterium RIFCSPHIGHO2_02_FULL_39_12]OGE71681.1 MAG: tRNA (guanosine(37)-N1)-methyltransferase TrmD [Candidatus Daviesbacteria bacterium RIFCSPLOWO2_02_FULL_38_15]